jgi:type II secretory pathway pseudopilin PulG
MKTNLLRKSAFALRKGASLIEVMIAMGVLAVAVPLVLGAMAQTGGSNLAAQAETRSAWITRACFEELQCAMRGQSQYVQKLLPGEEFGTNNNVLLCFGAEGGILGPLGATGYDGGVSTMAGEPARYIAVMSGEKERGVVQGESRGLKVKITIEYPSSAPVAKRQKLDFYTRIP